MEPENHICRICMTVTEDLLPMLNFTSENSADLLQIGEMFEQCFGIMIEEIPKYYKICMNCKIQLTYFHDFKLQAFNTHKQLLKLEADLDVEDKDEITNDSFISQEQCAQDDNDCNDEALFIEYLEEEDSVRDPKIEDENLTEECIEEEDIEPEDIVDESFEILTTEDEFFQFLDGNEVEKKSGRREKINSNKGVRWKHHCEPCGKYFRNEHTYNAHLNTHKGLPPYRCETCDKGFGFKVNYDYHMKNHNNNRRYKCSLCDKSFLCNWDLKIHMRIHDDVRPFVCDICGKQFRIRSHMTDHLETHNEENTYECPICQQKYKTRATLKVHISSIHVKDKQYFCPVCDRVFNRKHHLKVHYKVHENLKKES